MTVIQELILESDQLRLENDTDGPQDELEFWKCRAAKLSLLVDQISSNHCRLILATLKAAQSRLIRVSEVNISSVGPHFSFPDLEELRAQDYKISRGGRG